MYPTLWFLYFTVWDRENAGIPGKTDKEKQTYFHGVIRLYLPVAERFHTFFTQPFTLYADFSYLCIQMIKKQKEL